MILGSAENPATLHGFRGLEEGCSLHPGPGSPCPTLLAPPVPRFSAQTTHEWAAEVPWEPRRPQGLAVGFWLVLTKGPWKRPSKTRRTGRAKVMRFKRRQVDLVLLMSHAQWQEAGKQRR